MLRIILLTLLAISSVHSSSRRHVIYWNSRMSPQLLSKSTQVLHVSIGEFMDILCPQTSLMGITNGPEKPEVFDIFNVTKPDYDNCDHGGRRNFIFACDRPERENKLTIKFQLISPSPLGFRFQYCQDYYFVAVSRAKNSASGCQENVSTRLHISVACKNHRPPRPMASTTTKLATTTTSTTTLSELDVAGHPDHDILVPDIVNLHPTGPDVNPDDPIDVEPNQQSQTRNGDNASCHCFAQWWFIAATSFLAILFTQFLSAERVAPLT